MSFELKGDFYNSGKKKKKKGCLGFAAAELSSVSVSSLTYILVEHEGKAALIGFWVWSQS